MTIKKTAKKILAENIESYGEGKDNFTISPGEMKIILLSSGSKVWTLNKDNGDGTFFTSVGYEGKIFNCSSSSEI
jgi:hypothetical protein